jgi:hypothetical protein
MSGWLLAAGFYNLAWGAIAVSLPGWMLRVLGVLPAGADTGFDGATVAAQLWACIGMIVGVYGVGYLVASRDPARHWPIVLVGLLGKVFGPIGFLIAAVRDQLPWAMGFTILTNDVVWWVPFGMILWHSARAAQPAPPGGAPSLDHALGQLRDQNGLTLAMITDERPTVVLLLRHTGCTFCRESLALAAARQTDVANAGFSMAVVGMSPHPDALALVASRYGLHNASFIADPDRMLYQTLSSAGSFLELFGPRLDGWPPRFAGLASACCRRRVPDARGVRDPPRARRPFVPRAAASDQPDLSNSRA